MRTAILLGILAVGCGGPSGSGPTVTEPVGNQGGTDLAAVLEKEIGAGVPVAIVPGAKGLRAISADGARERTLAPGPVPWALVDARADVVWFGSPDGGEIRMIDLQGAGTVETVVTGLPTETDAGTPLVTIVYAVEDAAVELTSGHPITPHIMLVVGGAGKAPHLGVEGGILSLWGQDAELDAIVQQATIAGSARIAEVARRNPDKAFALGSGEERPAVVVDPEQCPDNPEACGTAWAVLPTKLWRVTTGLTCGDGCYTTYQLYDPDTQAFVEGDWTERLSDAWVAADGSAFVGDGVIVRFDRGPLAATPIPGDDDVAVSGGGWLGGAYYYGI
jgi:hypothetical protein